MSVKPPNINKVKRKIRKRRRGFSRRLIISGMSKPTQMMGLQNLKEVERPSEDSITSPTCSMIPLPLLRLLFSTGQETSQNHVKFSEMQANPQNSLDKKSP
jgi:hypothetical protein